MNENFDILKVQENEPPLIKGQGGGGGASQSMLKIPDPSVIKE